MDALVKPSLLGLLAGSIEIPGPESSAHCADGEDE